MHLGRFLVWMSHLVSSAVLLPASVRALAALVRWDPGWRERRVRMLQLLHVLNMLCAMCAFPHRAARTDPVWSSQVVAFAVLLPASV